MPRWKDRRRAQAGATLVELLVSVMIIGLALVLIIGTFSTGLLDATLAKRNTAAEGVVQYEMDSISGSQYNAAAKSYSECFATESSTTPPALVSYGGPCPSSAPYTLRADVSSTVNPGTPSRQLWTIAVAMWPANAPVGSPVSVYKVNR